MPRPPIPTHLIMGFLGVGKTTGILDLLSRKPANERWAVLVNEFGEVGIDGALLAGSGVAVREVPGGCMCCVAGLPMQIGLNMLISREKPDRLIIEPTGLGHPSNILETLTGEFYRDTLALHSTLCLVDPRRLQEERVLNNVNFRDQAAAADVLVANKVDLCSEQDLQRFNEWASAWRPEKARIEHTRHGHIPLEWLLGAASGRPVSDPQAHGHHHHHHHEATQQAPASPPPLDEQPWQFQYNQGTGHYSCGWRITPEQVFDHELLMAFCHGGDWLRLKGVMRTEQGWLTLNLADGTLGSQWLPEAPENRLEIISDQPLPLEQLERALQDMVGELAAAPGACSTEPNSLG
ncbi:MAG: GTP-binding protein [Halomonadaceae bacterium]|nr:MAG: GTP-binding protein [Halomonadaceae bacterium]